MTKKKPNKSDKSIPMVERWKYDIAPTLILQDGTIINTPEPTPPPDDDV